MCRNIRPLFNFEPPATDEEIHAAALQYVRKVSGTRKPSETNVDPFSTAIAFPGWEEYGDRPFLWRGPPTYDPLVVYQPRTWLLREGYKRGGPPISVHEVPSTPRQPPAAKAS